MGRQQQEEGQTTGGEYGGFVLNMWLEASGLSEEVHNNGAAENYDISKYKQLIVKLMAIWKQLAPKMENRTMKKFTWLGNKPDDSKQPGFFYFQKYESDESKMVEIKENITRLEELTKMEKTIRYSMEELGITDWG